MKTRIKHVRPEVFTLMHIQDEIFWVAITYNEELWEDTNILEDLAASLLLHTKNGSCKVLQNIGIPP
jgi:hypothetical protein